LDLLDDLQFLNDELTNLPVSLIEEINSDSCEDLNGNFLYEQLTTDLNPPAPQVKPKLQSSSSFDVDLQQPAVYCLFKSHSESELDFHQDLDFQQKLDFQQDLDFQQAYKAPKPPPTVEKGEDLSIPNQVSIPTLCLSPASFCTESEGNCNQEIEDLNLPEAVPPFHYQYENPPGEDESCDEPTIPTYPETSTNMAGGDSSLVELSTDAFLSSLYDGDLMDLETIISLGEMFKPSMGEMFKPSMGEMFKYSMGEMSKPPVSSSAALQKEAFNSKQYKGGGGSMNPSTTKKSCVTKQCVMPCMEHYHGLDDFLTEISESIFANMCWMYDWDLSPHIDSRDSFAQYWRPPNHGEPLYTFQRSSASREFPTLIPPGEFPTLDKDDDDDLYYMSMLALSVVESVVDRNGSKQTSPEHGALPRPTAKLGTTSTKGRLDEVMITDNEAWKTSLRINNMWQAIAGIRPVDVIYSEKVKGDDKVDIKVDNNTHFRPIRPSESSNETSAASSYQEQFLNEHEDCFSPTLEEAPVVVNSVQDLQANYGLHHFMDLPNTGEFPNMEVGKMEVGDPGKPHGMKNLVTDLTKAEQTTHPLTKVDFTDVFCDLPLQGLENELGNLLGGSPLMLGGSPLLPPSYKDNCMQTTFEQQIRMIDRDCNQLSIRPPKPNSR
jgi:hypothetical protein